MQKLFVLIPVIGISLMACQKEEAKTPTENAGIIKPTDLRTIQGPVIATNHWAQIEGDCFPGGSDCLDEVVCTPNWFQSLIDSWLRIQERERQMRKWFLVLRTDYGEGNQFNEDFGNLLGQDMFNQVLNGEYHLMLRVNDENEDRIFVGVFDSNDQIKLVIPVTKQK
ncbi:hypothetical protein D3C72_1438290 [compost metagenome]